VNDWSTTWNVPVKEPNKVLREILVPQVPIQKEQRPVSSKEPSERRLAVFQHITSEDSF